MSYNYTRIHNEKAFKLMLMSGLRTQPQQYIYLTSERQVLEKLLGLHVLLMSCWRIYDHRHSVMQRF